jgi:hypothetical protein
MPPVNAPQTGAIVAPPVEAPTSLSSANGATTAVRESELASTEPGEHLGDRFTAQLFVIGFVLLGLIVFSELLVGLFCR